MEILTQSIELEYSNTYLVVYQLQKADIFCILQNDFHDKNDILLL